MNRLDISYYLSGAKYSMLLRSYVVIVVCPLVVFNIET